MRTTIDLLHPSYSVGWQCLAPLAASRNGEVLDTHLIIEEKNDQYMVVHAEVRNPHSTPAYLEYIRWTHPENSKHTLRFPEPLSPRYFSTENYRSDYFGTGTCLSNRFSRPLPHVTTEIAWSEDQVFPGLFICAQSEPVGAFCATLTVNRLHPVFRLRGQSHAGDWYFEIDERPGSLKELTIAPGETFRGETLFFGLCDTNAPQLAACDYETELKRLGVFDRRKSNPLPTQRIWCSWNYDFFEKITEADIQRQIPVLREHFPLVKFIQIDDGYQKRSPQGHRAMIDLLYEDEEPFDREKFPSGPRGVADMIKSEGFRPSIWLGLWALLESRMIQDHPDWILHDELNRPLILNSSTYGKVCILDPSLDPVLEYLDHVAETVFTKWGYEGVKLDFSTFAFDGKRNRLRGGLTALECKNRVLDIFRRHLPDDGFFGWCLVAGTGHPLVGAKADYFRYAEDIGKGTWKTVQRIALWTVNTHLLMRNRPVLPNIDSLGWSRNFNEREWESWLNLCAISGCALEVSGDLASLTEARLSRIHRALEFSNPSHILRFLDLPTEVITHAPTLWQSQGNDSGLFAIFNWSDQHQEFTVPDTARLGTVRDAWTGALVDTRKKLRLEAHESILWKYE